MARRDLSAFFDDGLDYTAIPSRTHPGGRDYRVPCVDAKTGLWLTALTDVGARAVLGEELSDKDVASLSLDDDEERSLYQRILGSAFDEMVADGVSFDLLQRMGRDAYLCFAVSQEAADNALAAATEAAAAGEAAARPGRAPKTKTTAGTTRRKAGSSSAKASGGTRGRTRGQGSTRSSTSPNEPAGEPPAATG